MFQLNISDIKFITTYKYMGLAKHFRINKKGGDGESYRVVFTGENNEFTLWENSSWFSIQEEKK